MLNREMVLQFLRLNSKQNVLDCVMISTYGQSFTWAIILLKFQTI